MKTEHMFMRIIKPRPTHQTDVLAIIHHHAVVNVELFIHLDNSGKQTELTKLNVSKRRQILVSLRFFKVATLCLDDSFALSWHSFNQLHEVVTWNAFQFKRKYMWNLFSSECV